MLRLTAILFIVIAPTLAGTLMIALLTADRSTSSGAAVLLTAVAGIVLAAPASWLVARAISARVKQGASAGAAGRAVPQPHAMP